MDAGLRGRGRRGRQEVSRGQGSRHNRTTKRNRIRAPKPPYRFGSPSRMCKKRQSLDRAIRDELSQLRLATQPSISNKSDEENEPSDDESNQIFSAGVSNVPRIKSEFQYLESIGKGAYGTVSKYKNLLDRKLYAVKKIKLNPKNESLNKKIKREVKLISSLNHENVVRYYNSWIGFVDVDDNDAESISTISSEDETEDVMDEIQSNYSMQDRGDLPNTDEYYKSLPKFEFQMANDTLEMSSDDDEEFDFDDDANQIDFPKFRNYSIDSYVNSDLCNEFEDSHDDENEYSSSLQDQGDIDNIFQATNTSAVDKRLAPKQYLYIQMELCANITLRNAIDDDLYKDTERAWRLFRELIEGLNHIHDKGMMHRDLKPDNIFLDAKDHIKIGDFGWATITPKLQINSGLKKSEEYESLSLDDASLSRYFGTAVYTAPEVKVREVIYSQKVDIYSVGIILFEMFHAPLKTGMEKYTILTNLRLKEIVMPEEFVNPNNENKIELLRWLLNHDVKIRPSCLDLIRSKKIPFSIEKDVIQNVLHRTISDRKSDDYLQLIKQCFQKELSLTENIEYDKMFLKSTTGFSYEQCLLISKIKEKVEKIFKLHGGLEFITPLLLPSCKLYDPGESSVRLMTNQGDIVNIPHDLRMPFARYVALNGITLMRRYSIERIYQQTKLHPKEYYECAFDIVTPSKGSSITEAELLSIAYEVTIKLPSMRGRNVWYQLNHTNLLKAIMIELEIDEETRNKIYDIFSSGNLSITQIKIHIYSLSLDVRASSLFHFLIKNHRFLTLDKLITYLDLHYITSNQVRDIIKEFDDIIHFAIKSDVKCPIYISPLMFLQSNHYSGIVFKFLYNHKVICGKKHVQEMAIGGRYDNLLANIRDTFQCVNTDDNTKKISQSAVGVSLYLERLVQDSHLKFRNLLNVYVCSANTDKLIIGKQTEIAHNLWKNGIRAIVIDSENIKDIPTYKSCTIMIRGEDQHAKISIRHNKTCTEHIIEFSRILGFIKSQIGPSMPSTPSMASNDASTFYRSQPIV